MAVVRANLKIRKLLGSFMSGVKESAPAKINCRGNKFTAGHAKKITLKLYKASTLFQVEYYFDYIEGLYT